MAVSSSNDAIRSDLKAIEVPFIDNTSPKQSLPLIDLFNRAIAPSAKINSEDQVNLPIKIVATPISPVRIIQHYYKNAVTLSEKSACVNYLLHYQHYNAEFTREESCQLGYPIPLVAIQDKPGYIRTEFTRLLEIVKPWAITYIQPFLNKSVCPMQGEKQLEYFKLSSLSSIEVLKAFYHQSVIIKDFSSFCRDIEKKDANQNISIDLSKTKIDGKKYVISIEMTAEDLKEKAEEIVEKQLKKINKKLGSIRNMDYPINFLFIIRKNDIDCVILCAATWNAPRKDNRLKWLTLDELFEADSKSSPSVYSLLNKSGAVPDRLALNSFFSSDFNEKEFRDKLKDLKNPLIDLCVTEEDDLKISANKQILEVAHLRYDWIDKLEEISNFDLLDDLGSACFRDAILRWHACFFREHGLTDFAAPLLGSQVTPWIKKNGDITQWAKAYQNMCEVVMFCLQSMPDKFKHYKFEETLLKATSTDSSISRSAGIFPYAMSTLFHIFQNLLARDEFKNKKVSVACISQNYFETLGMMETFAGQGSIENQNKESLNEITEIPDILVADIHPNNAAKKALFQNAVADWIKERLTKNPAKKMVLVLDITLNYFNDSIIQSSLEQFMPFIKNQQLEFFGIQSLAKLVQLGADNFSGGMCLHLRNESLNQSMQFPAPIQSKNTFFSLMNTHFQDLIDNYFSMVRKNTDWMYRALSKRFNELSDYFWEGTKTLCAEVKLNVDEGTVYVAISFEPLMKKCSIVGLDQEILTVKLLNALQKFARTRDIVLTSRQSFGFSLCNVTPVLDSLRFCVGVEKNSIFCDYVDLLADFMYLLSVYASHKSVEFDLETFETGIIKASNIFEGHEPFVPMPVLVTVEEEEDDSYTKIHDVKMHYENNQLILKKADGQLLSKETSRYFINSFGSPLAESFQWIQLFFHLDNFREIPIKIYQKGSSSNSYYVSGVFLDYYPFIASEMVIPMYANEGDASLVTLPNLQKFPPNKIFVTIDKFGPKPVCLARLNPNEYQVFKNQCVSNEFVITHSEQGAIVKFLEAKPTINYLTHLVDLYKKGAFPTIVDYLNSVNLNQLPLPEKTNAFSNKKAPEALLDALKTLGEEILFRFSDQYYVDFLRISDKRCRKAILGGMYESLTFNYFNDYEQVDDKTTKFKYKFKQDKTLNVSSAKIIASLFSRSDFLPLGWYLEREHVEMWNSILEADPETITFILPYITALLPVIKKDLNLRDVVYSIPLKLLSTITGHAELTEHMTTLENQMPDLARRIKGKKTLGEMFRFYVKYPLKNELALNITRELKGRELEMFYTFLEEFVFYYEPIDYNSMEMVEEEDVVFYESDITLIQQFFNDTGFLNLLLSYVDKKEKGILNIALKWNKILQNKDLLSLLIKRFGDDKVDEVLSNLNYDRSFQHTKT